VIGPNGSGLANLLLASPPNSVKDKTQNCETRTKVLEFTSSPKAIDEKRGTSSDHSLFNQLASCPWLDYHHLFLQPESISESGNVGTAQTAVVDMSTFHLSLYEIFWDRVYRGSITVS
jgi:hypothetical protein